MSDSPTSLLDLRTVAHLHQQGRGRSLLEEVLGRVQRARGDGVWIHVVGKEEVFAQLERAQVRQASGVEMPLMGVPFAIKDNIDVAGVPTTAACPAYRYVPERSAPSVQRLVDAGAIVIGKTNLDQFACGLAGDRTPHGVCRNPFHRDYIAGGSSSGSAVAVSLGQVSFALGTDTAGSGRIPAGCTNTVGLKPTPGLIPTDGLVPACRSLDCVSVFALTVEDAEVVAALAAGERWPRSEEATSGAATLIYGMPRGEDLKFFDDAGQQQLFHTSLDQLDRLGGTRVAVDLRPFRKVADLLYEGPWLAERWAGVGEFVEKHPDAVHPVTRAIIRDGARYTAADLFRARYELEGLREICLRVFEQVRFLVVPTLPVLPKVAEVEAESRTWGRRLGTYTNFVNLLGLAALALPAGFTPAGLPGGITLIGPPGSDRRLAEFGRRWQAQVDLPLGATGQKRSAIVPASEPNSAKPPAAHVRVAVAGAHLRGQPLHADLMKTGARFVRGARTAPRYRFCAFLELKPPRPALLRDEQRAGAAYIELYDIPLAGFGALVASVAPPLTIGTVELEDGESVKGFLCESYAAAGARDISEFGGWVAFLEHYRASGARS